MPALKDHDPLTQLFQSRTLAIRPKCTLKCFNLFPLIFSKCLFRTPKSDHCEQWFTSRNIDAGENWVILFPKQDSCRCEDQPCIFAKATRVLAETNGWFALSSSMVIGLLDAKPQTHWHPHLRWQSHRARSVTGLEALKGLSNLGLQIHGCVPQPFCPPAKNKIIVEYTKYALWYIPSFFCYFTSPACLFRKVSNQSLCKLSLFLMKNALIPRPVWWQVGRV